MSESKSSLIDQFSEAIKSVKDRITGYNGQVKQYKQGVNANADRLRELVEKLRNCLEGLKNLKQNHEGFITKLQSIYQNIDTERQRAVEDNSTEEANKCNDKIKTIYDQFKELQSTLSEMDTDFSNTIGDQLEVLNGVIDELCKDGDGLTKQISSSSADVGKEVDNLESKFSARPTPSPSAQPSAQPSAGPSAQPSAQPLGQSSTRPSDNTAPVGTVQRGWIRTNTGWEKVNSQGGGWLSPQKIKSLSKTQPIRSLKRTFSKKRNKSKRNKSKRNKSKRNKTKRNKTKRNKTKRNKRTKRNK